MYHEYTSSRGTLIRRHYNGRRETVVPQPDWKARFEAVAGKVADAVGQDDYESIIDWMYDENPEGTRRYDDMVRELDAVLAAHELAPTASLKAKAFAAGILPWCNCAAEGQSCSLCRAAAEASYLGITGLKVDP